MIDVIPAIDLIDGSCVRLTKGDYSTSTVYSSDPVEMARSFADAGIKRLHLVDLDGARSGSPKNLSVLDKITGATKLIVDFGGGIKTTADLTAARDAGAAQVSIGSIAVTNPERVQAWLQDFPVDFFILCADVKGEQIAIHGWQEVAALTLNEFIQTYRSLGVKHFLCTSIDRDGMLSGSNVELYARLMNAFPELYLIASGGVASLDDIEALRSNAIPAVVVGKAFYEGHISLSELGAFYAK